MKKILITGGAGFIGSNLSLDLINKGYEITVLDNLSKQIHGLNPEKDSDIYIKIKKYVNFIKGDVVSIDDWRKCIKNQDAIIHLAAETGTGQSMYEINRYSNVNIIGTSIMLDILANEKHTVKKIIIASSRAIYGEGKYISENNGFVYPNIRNEDDMLKQDFECKCPITNTKVKLVPTTEDSLIHPTSVYGITKQNQEQMVMLVCKSLDISCVALRYQNVYGPGQSLKNPYTGILSIFSNLIKNNQNINIFEDGYMSRDFVYIEDVVNATVLALENKKNIHDVFNVGSGTRTSVIDVANSLIKIYSSNVKLNISGQFRYGDIRHNFADLKKIKQHLNYEPKWSFRNGIANFCNWVNIQKIEDSQYSKSITQLKERGMFK